MGTIGSRQMLDLLRLQERHGFRMVAIGDPKQCQSIEAGQVIGLLEKGLGKVPSIDSTMRQTNERAREIAGLLRKGGAEAVGKALDMKRQDGAKGAIGDNGSILEITAIRDEGLVLRNDHGREGFVKWDTLADKETGRMRLAYGYAMTTNTAQGIATTEHIFVTSGGSQTTDGFKTYVSGSRHRERDYWLTSEGAERREIESRRPLGDPRPIREHDIWTNWTRNIARQPEKTNALDLVKLGEEVRRNAARAFLKGLAADEKRQAAGLPDDLPRRFERAQVRVTQQGRVSEAMSRAAQHRETALARIERAAPAVRRAVATGWERARPIIEAAHRSARDRLRKALEAHRHRHEQRPEERPAEQVTKRRGRGR